MNKIVLFTQRVEYIESYKERRDAIDQNIVSILLECGYTPIPVPNNIQALEKILEVVKPNGIFLTGGNSLVKYGGNAPERDEIDSYLIAYSINTKTPLLGICRGMQSILDYYGVPLVNVTNHVAVRHEVKNNNKKMIVNSYHNQGCVAMNSSELETCFLSNDNVVEMVKHKTLPIVGIMWHPERENPFKEDDIKLIKELFN